MLHILLLILKIIGIIIAAILGILIVLLGIVLFVPVRYEVKASFDGKLSTAKAMAKVTWLARLFGVNVWYKGENLQWRARIAWKTVMASDHSGGGSESEKDEELLSDEEKTRDNKKEKGKVEVDEKKSERKDVSESIEKRTETPEKHEEKSVDAKAEKTVETDKKDAEKISETTLEERKNVPQKVEKPEKELEEEREELERESGKKRLGIVEKLQNIYHKIIRTKKAFCDKIKALSGKLKDLSEKKDTVMSFLQNEDHKKAWTKAKKEVWKLLKRLRPKCLKADIRYGFEDPSITGKILAGFSILYPFVGEQVHLDPDFEQSVIEGKLYIKGNVRIFTFIRTAWNLFWCKAIRKTYHDIKEFEL